jgi:hypothetical protein
VEAIGVSRRVALDYRTRTRPRQRPPVHRASPGTYATLENKLTWTPGSIDTILAGGEPKEPLMRYALPFAHEAVPERWCACGRRNAH